MTKKDLITKCKDSYYEKDYEKLLKLSSEVLKTDSDNEIAMSFKASAYCFLNQPEKALKIMDKGIKIYPDNYYYKNICAMAYYDLGDYEKSLKYCNQGLKINSFSWLYENKIKALLKLNFIDEAFECFENQPFFLDVCDLLIETGKYNQAFKYCLEDDSDDFESIIDKIKKSDASQVGQYYKSWIYKIKSKSNIRYCPECGGELIPIIWGYPLPDQLEKAEKGELCLGGCCIPLNCNDNYHCKNCNNNFDLGCEGLHIECRDGMLSQYIEYKIRQLTSELKINSTVFIKSIKNLQKEMDFSDDEEYMEFINHLKNLDYIYEPAEGYIKLVGYDDLKCAKEYPDKGKYAAPKWLVYPQLSIGTIGWRMGPGEQYAMNSPRMTEEYLKVFPMPRYWEFRILNMPDQSVPLLSYFWREGGKPEYQNSKKGIEVNSFITLNDEKEFISDTLHFKSINHALLFSKSFFFEKYIDNNDFENLKKLKFTQDENEIWNTYKYTVLLNACYFKIMTDEN